MLAIIATFVSVASALCANFITWPENSRLLLTRSIVDFGTVNIRQSLESTLTRLPNTFNQKSADVAAIGDKVFNDKPPGLSIIAIPIYYGAMKLLFYEDFFGKQLPGKNYGYLLLAVIFGTSGIANGWIFLQLARHLRPQFGLSGGVLLALLFSLGTIAFIYGGMFLQYLLAGALLLAAYRIRIDNSSSSPWSPLLCAVASGVTVSVEYLAFSAALLFFFSYLLERRWRDSILYIFALGCTLIPLMVYHYLLTGEVFSLVYAQSGYISMEGETLTLHNNTAPLVSGPSYVLRFLSGVFQISTLKHMFYLLFYPFRGIFFLVPLLLFAPLGYLSWIKRRDPTPLLLTALFPLLITLLTATKMVWWLHVGYGPRYLVTALPLLFLASVEGFRWGLHTARTRTGRSGVIVLFSLLCLLSAIQTAGGVRRLTSPPPVEAPGNDFNVQMVNYAKCHSSILTTIRGGWIFHRKAYLDPLFTEGLQPPIVQILRGRDEITQGVVKLDGFGLSDPTCNYRSY